MHSDIKNLEEMVQWVYHIQSQLFTNYKHVKYVSLGEVSTHHFDTANHHLELAIEALTAQRKSLEDHVQAEGDREDLATQKQKDQNRPKARTTKV